jgi:plastocyanin domain-containing protein
VARSPSHVAVAALVVASLSSVACKKDESSSKGASNKGASASASVAPGASASAIDVVGRRVDIDVGEHGFTPSEVDVKKGEPTTLVFTRSSNSTCAFEVVFPDLNVTKDLPLNSPVAVVVPVDQSRTLAFQCGMGMYKSKVVVQ